MGRRNRRLDEANAADSSEEEQEERAAFDITERDLDDENEYFRDPTARSKRQKFTKDHATYGIWADSDSDADEKSYRGKKNAYGDVAFVKSNDVGKKGDRDDEVDAMVIDDSEEEDEDEDEVKPPPPPKRKPPADDEEEAYGPPIRQGLGMSGRKVEAVETEPPRGGLGTGGLGFRAGLGTDTRSSSKVDDDAPTAFASTKRQNFTRSSSSLSKPSAQTPPVPVDKAFGKWQQHTTGFGLKMLQKMGYKVGEGLGSSKAGIVRPIETKQRPKGLGLAYQGFKEKTEQAVMEEKRKRGELPKEDKEKMEAGTPKSDNWKRSAASRKAKTEYKTAEEVILDSTGDSSRQASGNVKIIDMTGRKAREVTSAHISSTSVATPSPSEYLPELRHNLRLLVDLSKHDLERLTRERTAQRLREKALAQELAHTKAVIEEEARKERRLAEIMSLTTKIETLSLQVLTDLTVPLALDILNEPVQCLNVEYAAETEEYSLDGLVVAAIAPIVKSMFSEWEPLENPTFEVKTFANWRGMLKTNDDLEVKKKTTSRGDALSLAFEKQAGDSSMTPYESLMYSVWLPKVRSAINNTWDPRTYDQIILLLETWKPPILPSFIYENILDQLVMPKLQQHIEIWDPRRDKDLIHHWIHPWLPILGDRLVELFSPIRHKFAVALRDIKVLEGEGLTMLLPWNKVFRTKDMNRLVDKVVMPLLKQTMHAHFQVNPRNQSLAAFKAVMPWYQLSSIRAFSELLDEEFFPKWLRALYSWLTAQPNYEEVTQWYGAWKALFPPAILEMDVAKGGFKRALDMFNQSLELGGSLPHPDDATGTAATGLQFKPSAASKSTSKVTFRDLLEDFAQANSQLLLPTNRIHPNTGKPLLRFGGKPPSGVGGLVVCVDQDVVFVEEEGSRWVPVDFEGLLEKLKSKLAGVRNGR